MQAHTKLIQMLNLFSFVPLHNESIGKYQRKIYYLSLYSFIVLLISLTLILSAIKILQQSLYLNALTIKLYPRSPAPMEDGLVATSQRCALILESRPRLLQYGLVRLIGHYLHDAQHAQSISVLTKEQFSLRKIR